jgi:hypothetical protein
MIKSSMKEIIPEDELWTLPPRGEWWGANVVELGNKKNANGLYREEYEALGARYQCLDWNGQDGAISFDFGKPIPDEYSHLVGFADIVTNFGFTEHVYTNQEQAWKNVLSLAAQPNAILSIVLPYPTHWDHHGVYQPTMGWLLALLRANGFVEFFCATNTNRKRWVNCIGALRKESPEFVWPDVTYEPVKEHTCPWGKGIYITPPTKRVNVQEKNCGVKP